MTHPAEASTSPAWLEDVTRQSGIDFVHDAGPTEEYFMPQLFGSGAALFDFDDDGDLDLYLLQNAGPDSKSTNRLYRQEQDSHFTDISAGSGLDFSGYCMGTAVGDVNNDGWPDLVVTAFVGVRLFLNRLGDGTFAEVTDQSDLRRSLWATSAAFVDYDRDGWLDLAVANYLDYDPGRPCELINGQRDFCGPTAFHGTTANLYRNLGRAALPVADLPEIPVPAVRFEDVTVASGFSSKPGPGLGVLCADFDGDRWPDIFICNDGKPNHLWINQRDGTFQEQAVSRGVAVNGLGQAEANMGVTLEDLNGEGTQSLFVTHMSSETHTLWTPISPGIYRDSTRSMGLAATQLRGTGFGTALADFNHDGFADLAIVNGRIDRPKQPLTLPNTDAGLDPFWQPYVESNRLLQNNGHGRFEDVSPANPDFCGTPRVGRGLACGDLTGDGGLDLVATSIGGPVRIHDHHRSGHRRGDGAGPRVRIGPGGVDTDARTAVHDRPPGRRERRTARLVQQRRRDLPKWHESRGGLE